MFVDPADIMRLSYWYLLMRSYPGDKPEDKKWRIMPEVDMFTHSLKRVSDSEWEQLKLFYIMGVHDLYNLKDAEHLLDRYDMPREEVYKLNNFLDMVFRGYHYSRMSQYGC